MARTRKPRSSTTDHITQHPLDSPWGKGAAHTPTQSAANQTGSAGLLFTPFLTQGPYRPWRIHADDDPARALAVRWFPDMLADHLMRRSAYEIMTKILKPKGERRKVEIMGIWVWGPDGIDQRSLGVNVWNVENGEDVPGQMIGVQGHTPAAIPWAAFPRNVPASARAALAKRAGAVQTRACFPWGGAHTTLATLAKVAPRPKP